MTFHSPASGVSDSTSGASVINAFDQPLVAKPQLTKKESKLGKWLSHVHERLVMKLVCCAPASVVLEVELEDEDFYRPEDTETRKINSSLLLKKQKSASIAPFTGRPADDIPTNEELEKLPIDLSFVLHDNYDDPPTNHTPVPPPTPRHAALFERSHQLRQQQSARMIQRRWRHIKTTDAGADVEGDGAKTDVETDIEESPENLSRGTKTRRRRIRKHRGRKKRNH